MSKFYKFNCILQNKKIYCSFSTEILIKQNLFNFIKFITCCPFSLVASHHVMVTNHWKEAAKKALHLSDPWEEFHLEQLETEVVHRYRFNALRQTWIKDEVLVKIAKEVGLYICFMSLKLLVYEV